MLWGAPEYDEHEAVREARSKVRCSERTAADGKGN